VVIESLSVGTSVLISDKVGLSHFVHSNELGWITDLELNYVILNLNQIYKQQDKLKTISETAPAFIDQQFGGNAIVTEYVNMYKALQA